MRMQNNMNRGCNSCQKTATANMTRDNRTRYDQNKRMMDNKPCMKDGCDIGKDHVDEMAPGMAFVPWQKWQDIFEICEALDHGTIFKELDKPWRGRQ